MASIFLSYDHDDAAIAKPIAAALGRAGHIVWWDRHIHGGAQYSNKIEQALDAADAVVVIWSPRALESAWVRDEAAEGRDRGKLVPLSVGGVSPPMGFRQFQTIALGDWKGRGKVPKLDMLLEAVERQAELAPQAAAGVKAPSPAPPPPDRVPQRRPWWLAFAAAAVLALVAGGWWWSQRRNLPVVEVAAANASPRSQAGASDLFVKLGSLAQVGEGKWKLVDATSAPARTDYVFRTADTGSANQAQANLVLLDGKDDSLLWSREFSFPAGADADLRQQMSLSAGRVLGCALESRDAGGLRRDLLKLFLNSCATLAEASFNEPTKVGDQLRSIVQAAPRFEPAWSRLLYADIGIFDAAGSAPDRQSAIRQMQSDMGKARALNPDRPELAIAQLRLIPPDQYAQRLALLTSAAERAPNAPAVIAEQTSLLMAVGRMSDAVVSARRGAELDPLSPPRDVVLTLAAAGQIEPARQELDRMARVWPGTGALRDAMWAFHLRYGDPQVARRNAPVQDEGLDRLLTARADPSPANIARLKEYIAHFEKRASGETLAGAIQPLGEFGQTDDVLAWIARTPTPEVVRESYILFRPSLAGLRKDPRFMTVAKRLGLIDYWRSSGKWADFCYEPTLPYDCKAEAAKLG